MKRRKKTGLQMAAAGLALVMSVSPVLAQTPEGDTNGETINEVIDKTDEGEIEKTQNETKTEADEKSETENEEKAEADKESETESGEKDEAYEEGETENGIKDETETGNETDDETKEETDNEIKEETEKESEDKSIDTPQLRVQFENEKIRYVFGSYEGKIKSQKAEVFLEEKEDRTQVEDTKVTYHLEEETEESGLTVEAETGQVMVFDPEKLLKNVEAAPDGYYVKVIADCSFEIKAERKPDEEQEPDEDEKKKLTGSGSYEIEIVRDTTKPEIDVKFQEPVQISDGKYFYGQAMKCSFTMKEENMDLEKTSVGISRNGGEFQIIKTDWKKEDDRWTTEAELTEEGAFCFQVNCQDIAGNQMEVYYSPILVIDQEAPVIQMNLQGDNEKYASVEIEDAYLDEGSLDLSIRIYDRFQNLLPRDGNVVVSEPVMEENRLRVAVSFVGDGAYSFAVGCGDKCGNTAVTETKSFLIDRTAPTVLSVEYPQGQYDTEENGVHKTYYQKPQQVKISGSDNLSGVDYFTYTIVASDGRKEEGRIEGDDLLREEDGICTAYVKIPPKSLAPDGQFYGKIYVTAVDKKGNQSMVFDGGRGVIVDSISPKINVSYGKPSGSTNEALYFNRQMTVKVEVEERNFVKEEFVLAVFKNGEQIDAPVSWNADERGVYTGELYLREDGAYQIKADYRDRSGNQMSAYQSGLLIVDTTIKSPLVLINGNSANGYSISGDAVLSFGFVDTAAAKSRVTLRRLGEDGRITDVSQLLGTGNREMIGITSFAAVLPDRGRDSDGIYLLDAWCNDLAGNSIHIQDVFTVNRHGSDFVLDDMLKQIMEKEIQVIRTVDRDLVISEQNPDPLVEKYILIEHNGRIIENAEVKMIEREREIREDSGTGSWNRIDYVIGKENFKIAGKYRILIVSKDKAGNVSRTDQDQVISFFVDDQKPEITLIDEGKGKREKKGRDKERKIRYIVFDNVQIAEIRICLDDEVIQTISDFGEDLNNYQGELSVKQTGKEQTIWIKAVDICGNEENVYFTIEAPAENSGDNAEETQLENTAEGAKEQGKQKSAKSKETEKREEKKKLPAVAVAIPAAGILIFLSVVLLRKRRRH